MTVSAPSEVLGIHQSDIILRSAIIAAIADLRANPFLLDYAFASLAADTLTSTEYGAQEIKRAKEWFANTNVSVRMETNPNEPKLPCVSIKLLSSAEQDAEDTLADVHYVPQEDNDGDWPTLIGPINAVAWAPSTGALTLDPVALGTFVLAPGMIVLTRTGGQYPILDVQGAGNVVLIAANSSDQFAGVLIKPQRPAYVTTIESAMFRETYQLTCWVDSEEVHMTYLHSVLTFILLAYRETMLESRGFERCSVSSTAFERMGQFNPENVFARAVAITGTVRQTWPKVIALKLTGTDLELSATRIDDPDSRDAVALFGNVADNTAPPAPIIAGSPLAKAYYGTAPDPVAVTSGFVATLAASLSATVRQTTLSFNAPATARCWYAFPAAWGGTPDSFIDSNTALPASWNLRATVMVGGVWYGVWGSDDLGLGQVQVVVV